MTKEEAERAQRRLDELCDKHGIERFDMKNTGYKSGKWKALVSRMCGLDVPDATRGRTPDKNLEEAGMVAWLDQDLRGIKPKESNKEIIKQFNLKPKKSGHGVETDVDEMIRTARKRARKIIEKKASETKANKANPDTEISQEDLDRMME